MKKISSRHHKFLVRKSRTGNRRISAVTLKRTTVPVQGGNTVPVQERFVEVWDGKTVEKVLCLNTPTKPPSILCLNENTNQTIQFLHNLGQRVQGLKRRNKKRSNWINRKPNRPPHIKQYIGFEGIDVFATAPALIMAAIYERAKLATGEIPPAVNFPNWSAQAFQTLYEIGFFEIIGHAPAKVIQEVYVEKLDASYKVSKILTGKNADGLEAASDVIVELLEYLSINEETSDDLIAEINSAVSEAMINVAKHAYSKHFIDQSEKLCLKQWWMSAKADKTNNTLTIAVYDQGETIPGTLPKREWFQEKVEMAMQSIIPNFVYDGTQRSIDHEFINYSMKEGKTQTGEARRGLGLPQMQDLIDVCPDGTLSILSRQGLYKYDKELGVHKRRLDLELEGTLVEWKLTLPDGVSI